MEQTAVLLISCPDQPGIVAAFAQLLYGHGANILDSDQHVDALASRFFQRIRFDRGRMHTDRVGLEAAVTEVAQRFEVRWKLHFGEERKRVAIFVSRYDHCLVDLLWRYKAGELKCEIPLVLSNHPDLAETADHFGIAFQHIPVTRETKANAEAQQLERLREHQIDLVVMARYMQILSEDFIDAYPERIINIHHSFLPAFIGKKPYHQAYERGVKIIGATAHFATQDLDEGPIIEQDVARCSHRDAIEDLLRKGRDLEKVVLARAVRVALENRVLVYDNKTVVFD